MKVRIDLCESGHIGVYLDGNGSALLRQYAWPLDFDLRRKQCVEARSYAFAVASVLGCSIDASTTVQISIEESRLGMVGMNNHAARRRAARAA